jgi:hypothetical protein
MTYTDMDCQDHAVSPRYTRCTSELLRTSAGVPSAEHLALMQHRDLFRDAKDHVHVMFRKEQGQAPFSDDFGDEGDGIRRLLGDIPAVGSSNKSSSGSLAMAMPNSSCF